MKKIILLCTLLSGFSVLQAQSLEEGKQQLYYERYQTAENNLHAVLRQNPNEGEAWYWLTLAYLQQNETDKARDSLRLAPSSLFNQPYYKVAYGYLLLSENKQDSAAQFFHTALDETKSKDPAILSAIARAHIEAKEGNAAYALGLLDKAIKRDKRNAGLYVLKGNAYRKLNNGTEAFKAYREALEKDENLAAAHYQLGKIFVTQNNPDVYLDHFIKAIAVDKHYAPAYYELYNHYFYHDAAKAMEYFKQYAALSDPSIRNDYAYTDLLYLNKQYDQALQQAQKLVDAEGQEIQPRIYKLMAYSHQGLKDSATAITYMQQYLAREADSNFIAKDFETMADLYAATGSKDSAVLHYQKAVAREKDAEAVYPYYKKLAALSESLGDYSAQAKWLGRYYANNKAATNVDLFNWGLAHYRADEYMQADSVFGLYVMDQPQQGFGYYWQARSKAALDSTMEEGLAVPHYQKLIEVKQNDTTNANYKKWMVEAYAYLAAYETNVEKDYAEAVDYFRKLLEVDPENSEAKRYVAILEKNLEKEGDR